MDKAHGMLMVMGVTGSGKSTFVNLLKQNSVKVAHGLESGSAPAQAVQINLDKTRRRQTKLESITVIDTPGFDDSKLPDSDIFQQIARCLAVQYELQIPLKGFIYLHQISEPRMRGTDKRYLSAFQQLCAGSQTLENVIFLTTKWDCVSREDGLRREQELINDYWAPFLEKGAQVMRFNHRSPAEANAIVRQLISGGHDLVLDIQRELMDQEKCASETSTGTWYEKQFGSAMDDDIGPRARRDTSTERKKFKHRLHGSAAGISILVALLKLVLTVISFAAFAA
ncbi:P-loop containing nucleoside triphosphate hydrolase protein [Cladorrhinum sp. PSN259]|nr:P-loop containing nucleoside triphosphate hydrolase protein [Cladorrhinum sp. PSN259]